MLEFIWLIPIFPLFAAVLIGLSVMLQLNQGEKGEKRTALLLMSALGLSLLSLLILDIGAFFYNVPGHLVSARWFGSGDYQVMFSFTLDHFGLVMATLSVFICLITVRFSINYLHREAGFQRFFMVMGIFSSAMLLIFMAGNVVLTFAGWELAGVSSYLLIGYFYDRENAAENATLAFITNRIGDVGFVLGIALSLLWLGGVEWPDILAPKSQIHTLNAGLIGLGFLIAAMAKSALVPFSPWIGRALEGPTPSSAVFYGSIMVHAGVYLMIRLYPLFEQAPALLVIMIIVGILTALYGWLSGLVQTDVKSGLIFSTTAQIGLMFIEIGMGWILLASIHLVLHSMWRAYQFLHAPGLMHLVPNRPRPALQWLRKKPRLFTMALQRFWLEPMAYWLLVRPTKALAQDTQDFDQQIVIPFIGFPNIKNSVDLANTQPIKNKSSLGQNLALGMGLAGHIMLKISILLEWFEARFILQGAGAGLQALLQQLGNYLNQIDSLLSQPRYLLVLIMATFAVII